MPTMLDIKIQYIIDNIVYIRSEIIKKYTKGIDIYGKQEATVGIYVEMLYQSLLLPMLGESLRLELYKKINSILTETKIMSAIPKPIIPSVGTGDPYYYGSAAKDLTVAQLQSLLSKAYVAPGNIDFTYSAVEQVFYFCSPSYLGSLVEIRDINLFNTSNGWKLRTETFIIEGQSVEYYVYETKYITTLNNFRNFFYYTPYNP